MDKQPIQHEVILGVDTHLDTHVGVIIDGCGKMLDVLSIETNIHWISSIVEMGTVVWQLTACWSRRDWNVRCRPCPDS